MRYGESMSGPRDAPFAAVHTDRRSLRSRRAGLPGPMAARDDGSSVVGILPFSRHRTTGLVNMQWVTCSQRHAILGREGEYPARSSSSCRHLPGGEGGAGTKVSRQIERRDAFRKVEIYLPKVLHVDQTGARDLDYETDLLAAIDWRDYDPAPVVARMPENPLESAAQPPSVLHRMRMQWT